MKDQNDEAIELLWSITEKLDKIIEQLAKLNAQLTGNTEPPKASPP
jgi:hypothetical protein